MLSGKEDASVEKELGGGEIVVFLSLEQLRLYGPIALREYLKRTQRAPRTTGSVVEWGHDATGRMEP